MFCLYLLSISEAIGWSGKFELAVCDLRLTMQTDAGNANFAAALEVGQDIIENHGGHVV